VVGRCLLETASAAPWSIVAKLIRVNEYKQWQAPVGIRVTHRSFSKDWRYPIAGKFRAQASKKEESP
jgi:hypothetical protein